MRKLTLSVAALALLAVGGLGQVLGARLGGYIGQENLALLWINALELSAEQMKSLLALVDELMPLRDEILGMPDKLHEDLISFTGTPKELRELLASYQKELQGKLQALEDKFVAGLKKILTLAQWEKLRVGLNLGERARVPERFGFRAAPYGRFTAPKEPSVRIDLLRGMTLVRFLPSLKEALTAKLEALGK